MYKLRTLRCMESGTIQDLLEGFCVAAHVFDSFSINDSDEVADSSSKEYPSIVTDGSTKALLDLLSVLRG